MLQRTGFRDFQSGGLAAILVICLAGAASCPAVEKESGVEPVPVKDSMELTLFSDAVMNDANWKINNWKKKQEVALAFPRERTPTNKKCIRIEFKTPGGGCNVIAPVLKKGGKWRGQYYGGISFWIKGNGNGRKVRFWVSTESGSYSFSFGCGYFS